MRMVVLLALAIVVGSLILSVSVLPREEPPAASLTEAPWQEGFSFEWWTEEEEAAYLFVVDPGAGVCQAEHEVTGRLSHESGIGSYGFSKPLGVETQGSTGSAIRGDDSVHAGPVNTAHLTGPAWGQFWQYGGGWAHSSMSDYSFLFAQAAFEITEMEPLRVDCDSADASLRFHLADAVAPFTTGTMTGGVGVESSLLYPPGPMMGLNVGDRVRIATHGAIVVFAMSDFPAPAVLEPHLEGELVIRSPGGEEVVPLEPNHWAGMFTIHRIWEGPGVYEVEITRLSMARTSMAGILAGFVLEESIG